MSPPHLVRAGRPADLDAIAELRIRSWQAGYRGIVPDRYLDAMPAGADAFRAARERFGRRPAGDRPLHHLVAERDGDLTGFAICGPDRGPAPVGGPVGGPAAGELYALYVAPEHWSTGAGRALLAAVRERLAADGYRSLALWVLAGNARARRFYERNGLRPSGRHRTITLGVPLPEVRYQLDLTAGSAPQAL